MVRELKYTEMSRIASLFDTMEDSVILSCLQGYMGRAWAEDSLNPRAAMIFVGGFCFLAGNASSDVMAKLIEDIFDITESDFMFLIPETKEIGDMVSKTHGERCKVLTRYGIKKKQTPFDREKLEEIARRLPEGFQVQQMNEELYDQAISQSWSKYFVNNFKSKEDFLSRGLGIAIVKDGILASAASSFSVYRDGIEVEIATNPDYQRLGLAKAAGAALILACMERGLYPSWDAANLTSVHLAETFGYEYKGPYDTYRLAR